MTRIAPDLLSNTLNLIQLARETAQAKGKTEQAQRLAPVADNLRELVTSEQHGADAPAPAGGVIGQSDFQFMLRAAKSHPAAPSAASAQLERTQVVGAMASAGMNLTDIARQMGMTQDEVRLILDVSQKARSAKEINR